MELKPCAHCGYEAVIEIMKVRKGYEAVVQCCDCPASMHTITYDTEQEAYDAAAAAWNRRADKEE